MPAVVFDTDEHPRRTSLEALAKLPAVFKEGGQRDRGQLLRPQRRRRRLVSSCRRMRPAARHQAHGAHPQPGRGRGVTGDHGHRAGARLRKALELAGLTFDDIDVIELNEAFAAQSLAVIKELGLQHRMADINPNGGAVALGHPLGDSGARILTTLLYEMKRRGSRYGLATACIAGGQGIATIVEGIY